MPGPLPTHCVDWMMMGADQAAAGGAVTQPKPFDLPEAWRASGAFCEHGAVRVEGAATGPLAGLTFAVKDLIDVAGVPTGAGNPDWLDTHPTPSAHAPVVQRLLDAGATIAGKTHTDELAFSLFGENAHYGTPINAAAPDRVPGGSSSGSASAVSHGFVDFALGTDTGGSVRVPSSYCGLYGIRPSHGRVPVEGVVPLAVSLDTVGWFANDPDILRRVGEGVFGAGAGAGSASATRLLIAEDAFAQVEPAVRAALEGPLNELAAHCSAQEIVAVAGDDFDQMAHAFVIIASVDAWTDHGEWIDRVKPRFGFPIARRFAFAAGVDGDALRAVEKTRDAAGARLEALTGDGAVLAIPTTPTVAPKRGLSTSETFELRDRTLKLTTIAGLAGAPQINLPLGAVDGVPVGLSLVAAPGRDLDLLAIADAWR